jgi:hypothetical protein
LLSASPGARGCQRRGILDGRRIADPNASAWIGEKAVSAEHLGVRPETSRDNRPA